MSGIYGGCSLTNKQRHPRKDVSTDYCNRSFALLNEITGWSYWPCYLIALLCSILWNFTLNRKFTFRSAANVPVAMMKVLGFYAVFTPATTILGSYLADTLMWNEYLVTGINMGLNFVTEYLYQRYVVYRNSLDTQK